MSRSQSGVLLALALAGRVLLSNEALAQSPAVETKPSCAELAAQRVQAHYDSVRDLSANFEQRIQSVLAGPGSDAASRGRVSFSKPGKMRWTYEEPQPSEVISDGNTLWLYDPTAREAQKLAVTEGYLAGAGLQFLLGEGDLAKEFWISAERCGEQGQKEVELELLPRVPASYERMRLRVRADSGEVLATSVVDLFGNQTQIVFTKLQRNQDPPDSLFRFEAPVGVEIIDLVLPR